MLYAAKCYWPGVTETDLQQVAGRAAATGLASGGHTVTCLGSLPFTADDLVLCLFQGPSRAAVIQASDQLGIPVNGSWNRSGSAQTSAPPRGAEVTKRPAGTAQARTALRTQESSSPITPSHCSRRWRCSRRPHPPVQRRSSSTLPAPSAAWPASWPPWTARH